VILPSSILFAFLILFLASTLEIAIKHCQIAMGSTADFTPLADTALFKPVDLGALKLEHRLVLSPLTRMRGTKESDGVWVPTTLNVEYYSQRASKGGFMLTEATPISRLVSVSKQRV
jgi:hypothetical protein